MKTRITITITIIVLTKTWKPINLCFFYTLKKIDLLSEMFMELTDVTVFREYNRHEMETDPHFS